MNSGMVIPAPGGWVGDEPLTACVIEIRVPVSRAPLLTPVAALIEESNERGSIVPEFTELIHAVARARGGLRESEAAFNVARTSLSEARDKLYNAQQALHGAIDAATDAHDRPDSQD